MRQPALGLRLDNLSREQEREGKTNAIRAVPSLGAPRYVI
jgi:hypothetical protein